MADSNLSRRTMPVASILSSKSAPRDPTWLPGVEFDEHRCPNLPSMCPGGGWGPNGNKHVTEAGTRVATQDLLDWTHLNQHLCRKANRLIRNRFSGIHTGPDPQAAARWVHMDIQSPQLFLVKRA